MVNHGLRDINIETEYRSSENDIINEFYIPMLKESIGYKRAVGFFSSSSLKEISKGLKYFVKNNGKIRIVTSPNLSEEDIEAIKKGYELRDKIIENCLLRELNEPETENEKEELKILADLISENILDIKIAFIKNENNIGIYHEKLGIFEDEKNEKVVFTGSLNETLTAMTLNYETIDIFTSWNDCKRVEKKERAFNSIWNNKEKNIEVLEFPKLKTEIMRRYQYKKSDLSFFPFEENSDNNIYEINEEVLDDIELFDMLSDMLDDDINSLHIGKVITKLLGKDGRKKMYDHLRTEDGRVPASAIANEVMDIFSSFKVKN